MSKPAVGDKRDIFISRAGQDKDIALLVEKVLRDAGFSTYIQDKDFGATAFTQRMDQGMRMVETGARIVAIMSEAYMASPHCQVEAQYPLIDDPMNERQRLVVLRIDDCEPTGLLKPIPYIDLEPLLGDAEAFAVAVKGAVAPEHDFTAGHFASLFRRSGRQIVHSEVRTVPGFAGRELELAAIEAALWAKGGKAALTNAGAKGDAAKAAVRGLGGVGKSVLAQQYAWASRERYAGVWWVHAETRDQITADLVALGARLMPGLDEMPDRGQAARITLDAIAQGSGEKPWLMVYDNVEAPETIAQLTPQAGAHLLITSRWADWHGQAEEVAIDVFPRPLAMEFLLAHARKSDGQAAGRLADDLGRLPLALAHARATSWAMGLDFDKYRALLPDLIKKAPRGADYPEPVFATFDLAIKRAAEQCPKAETLVAIAAYLAPNRIPLDIVTADVMSAIERGEAIAALTEVLLASLEPLDDGSPGLSVHRLVQAVMRERLGSGGAEHIALATRLVAEAYPHGDDESDPSDVRSWPTCQRLNEHAQTVLSFAPAQGDAAQWTSRLLNQLGIHLQARADFDEAEPLMRRALGIDEKNLSAEHPQVAIRLSNLALLLGDIDRIGEAEPLARRALAIVEKSYGPEHPSVAATLINLASLLQDSKRPDEAEPLLRRALSIDEKCSGPSHPSVARDLSNLATLLQDTKRATEAEPMMRRALTIDENSYGQHHPTVAIRLGNLAQLLLDSKRYDEAEQLVRRALAINEATFDPGHPAVGTTLNNLSRLLHETNRRDEALPLMRRALAIDEAIYGPEHPIVALRYANLANLLFAMNRPADADPLIRHAFLTTERALGPDHPDTKGYRESYDKIMAAVGAIAKRDDAVEAGLAPAPPERLARPDIPPPPAKRGILGRLLRRKA